MDYSALRKKQHLLDEKDRFIPFQKREHRSDLSLEAIRSICHGKYLTHWKGIEMMKDPLDLIIYQQLLWEVRPKTIIELGAYAGGSALWMADMSETYQIDCHICSVDINLELLDDKARSHSKISFVEGDCNMIGTVLPPASLQEFGHPWVIIEDAHVNPVEVLNYFHNQGIRTGDYVIVEDTNPDIPAVCGMGLYEELGYEPWGPKKLKLLEEFMALHANDYDVDAYYTDMFGYNGTWNWNGYLKRR